MKDYKEIKLKCGLTMVNNIVWKAANTGTPTDGGHGRKSNIVKIRTPKSRPAAE